MTLLTHLTKAHRSNVVKYSILGSCYTTVEAKLLEDAATLLLTWLLWLRKASKSTVQCEYLLLLRVKIGRRFLIVANQNAAFAIVLDNKFIYGRVENKSQPKIQEVA